MKTKYIAFLIAMSSLMACNSGSPETRGVNSEVRKRNDTLKKRPSEKSMVHNDFAEKAAIAGMMEVESSVRLLKSTENPDVQSLATIMVRDHNMANKELSTIAKRMKLTIPTLLPTFKTVLLTKMDPLQEEEKNRYYADLMVKEHIEAVALFEEGSKTASGELRTFAIKNLPTLKHHLMHAKDVQKMLYSIKNDKGDRPLKISQDQSH